MSEKWVSCFLLAILTCPILARSQTSQSNSTAPTACPIEILSFDPSGVTVHIRNTSGKTIVGLVFNAAISDATEHWKWVHWDFDDSRPLRDFGWDKAIKQGATKRLTWDRGWGAYLDFEHIGGGAFVLTSVLFDDGSRWQEMTDGDSCKCLWYKHKKSSFRPIELPPRQATSETLH
jgi:hypothetical protein